MKHLFIVVLWMGVLHAMADAQVKRVGNGPGSARLGGVRLVDNTDASCSDVTRAPYCSIAAAIADALPGDTIHVVAGIYSGGLEIATRGLTLEGGAGLPEIDGSGSLHAVRVTADDVTIRGFTLRNTSNDAVRAEMIESLAIADNVFRHNGGDGVELRLCTGFSVVGNDFVGNVQNGLQLQGCDGGTVTDNFFFGNANEGVGAFDFLFEVGCDENVFAANVFLENTKHGIICVGDRNVFCENTSTRSGFQLGDRDFEGLHVTGDLNYAFDNLVVESNGEGYHIHGLSNWVAGNRAVDCSRRGFFVDGDMNLLVANHSERAGLGCVGDCDYEGFFILGDDNRLFDNAALESLTEGIVIVGDRNFLRNNVAEAGGSHGFEVEKPRIGESADNHFFQNASRNNLGFGFVDVTVGGSGPAGSENKYEGNTSTDDVLGPSDPVGLIH